MERFNRRKVFARAAADVLVRKWLMSSGRSSFLFFWEMEQVAIRFDLGAMPHVLIQEALGTSPALNARLAMMCARFFRELSRSPEYDSYLAYQIIHILRRLWENGRYPIIPIVMRAVAWRHPPTGPEFGGMHNVFAMAYKAICGEQLKRR